MGVRNKIQEKMLGVSKTRTDERHGELGDYTVSYTVHLIWL